MAGNPKISKEKIIEIALAIAAFLTASPFIISFVFDQITGPLMTIEIKEEPTDSQSNNQTTKNYKIDVRNLGVTPATNVSLILDTNSKIRSIQNIISTTPLVIDYPNVTEQGLLPKGKPIDINSQSVIVNTSKLIDGEGSRIFLGIVLSVMSNDTNTDNLDIYAVYDQGSKVGYSSNFWGSHFQYMSENAVRLLSNYLYVFMIIGIALFVLGIVIKLIQKASAKLPSISIKNRNPFKWRKNRLKKDQQVLDRGDTVQG
jgi:hypothetical protein